MIGTEIYHTVTEAISEIETRQTDNMLRKKVIDFWNGDFPKNIGDTPKALIFRSLLTPNLEVQHFNDMVKPPVNLEPFLIEYTDDVFCSHNKDKVYLGKLSIIRGYNKLNQEIISKRTIIDFIDSENKPFSEIVTFDDGSFVDYHHSLYIKRYGKLPKTFDVSFFKKENLSPKEVYERIFSLCIMNGVLFENFIRKDNEHEKEFSEKVVIPAYNETVRRFGVKPLIVPLLPLKSEERVEWMWYKGDLFN